MDSSLSAEAFARGKEEEDSWHELQYALRQNGDQGHDMYTRRFQGHWCESASRDM
jgi:hypothetical protein